MKMAQYGSTAKNVMAALAVGGAAAAVSGAVMMSSGNSLKKAKKNVKKSAAKAMKTVSGIMDEMSSKTSNSDFGRDSAARTVIPRRRYRVPLPFPSPRLRAGE